MIFVRCNDLSQPFIYRKPYGNVTRWFTTVVNQPNVKKVVGSFTLCEKMAQFDGKKYAEFVASQVPVLLKVNQSTF
jgi:hypothetical protein